MLSEPDRRAVLLEYVADLLESGAENLVAAGLADDRTLGALHDEFAEVHRDPAIEFEYHATRLICRPPLP